jgi:hypothetical protein
VTEILTPTARSSSVLLMLKEAAHHAHFPSASRSAGVTQSFVKGNTSEASGEPPFNTGQAFEHYDDWMEHSTWLSFMRERLLLIRELLAPDGSVWVHLDDAEQHRMRLLNRTTATRWWKFGTVLTVGAPGLRHLGRGARRGCGLTTRCTSPSTPGLWEG